MEATGGNPGQSGVRMETEKQKQREKEKQKALNFLEDVFWGTLPIMGVLAATFLVALVMRLSLGKW